MIYQQIHHKHNFLEHERSGVLPASCHIYGVKGQARIVLKVIILNNTGNTIDNYS
jgi:hypothetical protein